MCKKSRPAGGPSVFLLFLREMHVVEDVVLTEAVVPDALAAVTELQIRVVGIRAAADGALVAIALLLGLLGLLLLGLTELDGLAGVLVFGALLQVVDLRPDEHGEVQQGHDGQHYTGPVVGADGLDDVEGEQCAVQVRQPLHLHGEDEEQQHRGVREQEGKGEEHGQVHIAGARCGQVGVAGDETGQHHAKNRQQRAADVVQVELGRAPLALQRGADPVIEVETDQQGKGTGVGGHEHKGHQPPHLAVEQCIEIEGQKAQGVGVVVLGQQHEHIDRNVADDDNAHEVGNAEPGMGGAEALHPVIEFFQGECPPVYKLCSV